jgi:hypothetical protein
MQVNYLPDPEQHPLWPQIRALLEPAAKFGDVAVECPNQVIWIAHEDGTVYAAATTVLYQDEAELRLAGGYRHRDWAPQLSETVSGWAKSAGAKKLTMKGRRGWARYARVCGWVTLGKKENGMIYEKVL